MTLSDYEKEQHHKLMLILNIALSQPAGRLAIETMQTEPFGRCIIDAVTLKKLLKEIP